MSTTLAAFQRPQITRVDLAPHTKISSTIVHPASRSVPPFANVLKPISHSVVKPHVAPIRNQLVRRSGGNNITLPKLNTPGRNRSMVDKTDMLSPVRNYERGSISVRNVRGPAAIITEAKLIQQRPPIPTLPPNAALKNYTALELSRFIDKRLTDVTKSNIKYARQNGMDDDLLGLADDQQGQKLRAKLYGNAGRKEIITNKTNFRDIENPFGDYSLTLQTIKKEKHQAWKLRKEQKSLKLKNQIAEMEKKLTIYRKYKDEMGVTLTKNEREKVLNQYDPNAVELLMGRKMFTMRQVQAAVRIQCWWRKAKLRAWFSLITNIRHGAATRIQRAWRNYMRIRIWPDLIRTRRDEAATVVQAYLRGMLVRKHYWHEISVNRMNNCFEFFSDMQLSLQKGAILFIVRHWKRLVARRKREKALKAEQEKRNASMKKKKTNQTSSNANIAQSQSQKRGSIGKQRSNPPSQSAKSNSGKTSSSPQAAAAKKDAQKSDTVFMTGLKKNESQGKSKESLHQKSQESLNKNATLESATQRSVRQEDSILQAEKINLIDKTLVQSQEEIRLQASSPLEVEAADAGRTQELKMAFKGEGGVIHEVDEENQPEEQSEAQRHSILKGERGNHSGEATPSASVMDQPDATKQHFSKDQRIERSREDAEDNVSQNQPDAAQDLNATGQVELPGKLSDQEEQQVQELNATGPVEVPAKLSDNEQQQVVAEMASTGEVAVRGDLNIPANEEALEMQETKQVAVEGNLQSNQEIIVPTSREQDQIGQPDAQSVQRQSYAGSEQRDVPHGAGTNQQSMAEISMQDQQVAYNFSQDKISLGATDQPVSITLIPGKLNEEQDPEERKRSEAVELADIAQLNKDSEAASSRQPKQQEAELAEQEKLRGSIESPQLRESKKSAGLAKQVQKSHEQPLAGKSRASEATNPMRQSKGSFKQVPASRKSGLSQMSPKASQNGSFRQQKDPSARASQKSQAKQPPSQKAPSQRSMKQRSAQGVVQQPNQEEQVEVERVVSRQSVREMVQERRPSQLANEERGDKFSAYKDSDSDYEQDRPQEIMHSFKGANMAEIVEQAQAQDKLQQEEGGPQEGQKDEEDYDEDFSQGPEDENEAGIEVEEKGENKGRYGEETI